MPDSDGQCTFCHHDSMHHVWPGCDFVAPREIELIPGAKVWVRTCGCSGFDQPGEMRIHSSPEVRQEPPTTS